MNPFKDKLDAIKLLLGVKLAEVDTSVEEPSTTTETEQSTATAKDGTIIKWDGELAQGVDIFVVGHTGQMPAPDGNIEFEDGTIVAVSAGKVTSITASVAPEQSVNDMPVMASVDLEPINAEILELRAQMVILQNKANEVNEANNLSFSKIIELVELMNVTPEVKAEPIGTNFSKQEEKQNRINALAAAIKSLPKR